MVLDEIVARQHETHSRAHRGLLLLERRFQANDARSFIFSPPIGPGPFATTYAVRVLLQRHSNAQVATRRPAITQSGGCRQGPTKDARRPLQEVSDYAASRKAREQRVTDHDSRKLHQLRSESSVNTERNAPRGEPFDPERSQRVASGNDRPIRQLTGPVGCME